VAGASNFGEQPFFEAIHGVREAARVGSRTGPGELATRASLCLNF